MKDILTSKGLSFHHTYFAKKLKRIAADKYNLDFDKMESSDYKKQTVPWIISEKGTPKTVREILIEEGIMTRKIWKNTWSAATYKEIFSTEKEIGLISDYRFFNEYTSFTDICTEMKILTPPKIIRALVHRPYIPFDNDGADDELPDIEGGNSFWDVIINNNDCLDWQKNLQTQLLNLVNSILGEA
jgi:hypothetical protein